jgi:hypothetical protein
MKRSLLQLVKQNLSVRKQKLFPWEQGGKNIGV